MALVVRGRRVLPSQKPKRSVNILDWCFGQRSASFYRFLDLSRLIFRENLRQARVQWIYLFIALACTCFDTSRSRANWFVNKIMWQSLADCVQTASTATHARFLFCASIIHSPRRERKCGIVSRRLLACTRVDISFVYAGWCADELESNENRNRDDTAAVKLSNLSPQFISALDFIFVVRRLTIEAELKRVEIGLEDSFDNMAEASKRPVTEIKNAPCVVYSN